MKKRMAVMVAILLVAFGGIFGWKAFVAYKMKQALAHRALPPVAVSTAVARTAAWRPELHAVGSLSAVRGVEISPQLPGAVIGLYFRSGQCVKTGAPLVQIDNSNQKAQLNYDLAQEQLALTNLKRTRQLFAKKASSRAQLDSAEATYKSAVAKVANDRAILDKLALRAPFAGCLGIRRINLGQYLAPGTPVVTLQSFASLYVNFTVPQKDLAHLHPGQPVELTVDAYPGKVFHGRIHALNAEVNSATRNIEAQADIPNPDNLLRPGMFGNVRVLEQRQEKVLVIPATAIAYNTYGDYVFVVQHKQVQGRPQLIALQRLVRVSEQRAGEASIREGLRPGEVVVTAGQVKLRNGMPVVVNNAAQP